MQIRQAVSLASTWNNDLNFSNTMFVYEVSGMILLQVYLYTYSLLRRVTFEVLPFSNCALSQTMLSLLETFLERLLWNSFQCHHFFWMSSFSGNLRPFDADFISGNSQKYLGANSGEWDGRSILVIDFSWPETAGQRVSCYLERCHGGEFNRAKVQAFF
jgi:hypothetical protein